MANENEKPALDKANDKGADKKPALDKVVAEAPPALPYTLDEDGNAKTGNLTRDSIIQFRKSKLVEEGKADGEAFELAVKQGFKQIPLPKE